MDGRVRAIMWDHAHALGAAAPPTHDDPNDVLPSADFAAAISADDARGLGHAFALAWARTFRRLVQHWRGEPAHALQAFVDEVHPHLRDAPDAARLESGRSGRARLVTDGKVPDAYMAGLVEGFVGLTGARCKVSLDAEVLDIRYSLPAADAAIHWARRLAALRIPLLVTSLLAASIGVVAATLAGGSPDRASVLAVLAGTLAAQAAANGMHDLAGNLPRPVFRRPGLSRRWLRMQTLAAAAVALGALAWLAMDRPAVLIFAGLGLMLAFGYARARDAGHGPLVAGLSHGPIIVWGALVALGGAGLLITPVPAILIALPSALLAAAMVHLDDLIDRPFDEAAGRRTLAVRLPDGRQTTVFAALLLVGTALVPTFLAFRSLWLAWGASLIVIIAMRTALVVHTTDDPRNLARARPTMFFLYVAAMGTLIVGGLL